MRTGGRVGFGVSMVVLALSSVAPAVVRSRGEVPQPSRSERREWAAERMDEMANERRRCRERFTSPREVDRCEAEYQRRFREYNELYLRAPAE